MIYKHAKISVLIFIGIFLFNNNCSAQTMDDKYVSAKMRKIGDQILLSAGDSLSRVLPIDKKSDSTYIISFDTKFALNTSDIIDIIDSVIVTSNITRHYFVEIENCDTKEIVYSYELDSINTVDIVACRTRDQPKACYIIYITFVDLKTPELKENDFTFPFIVLIIIILIIIIIKIRKNKSTKNVNKADLINLGKYDFDKNNMSLIFKTQKTELTSKEADLLFVLYNSVNEVVERDILLQKVWGDEGDYVGRTLDVFVSKLRKKIVLDPELKIINIRGIGYKLVVN
jgi:hypothetical protein